MTYPLEFPRQSNPLEAAKATLTSDATTRNPAKYASSVAPFKPTDPQESRSLANRTETEVSYGLSVLTDPMGECPVF